MAAISQTVFSIAFFVNEKFGTLIKISQKFAAGEAALLMPGRFRS